MKLLLVHNDGYMQIGCGYKRSERLREILRNWHSPLGVDWM